MREVAPARQQRCRREYATGERSQLGDGAAIHGDGERFAISDSFEYTSTVVAEIPNGHIRHDAMYHR